jgi:hypothetical protein
VFETGGDTWIANTKKNVTKGLAKELVKMYSGSLLMIY